MNEGGNNGNDDGFDGLVEEAKPTVDGDEGSA